MKFVLDLQVAVSALIETLHPIAFSYGTDLFMVEVTPQQSGNVGNCHSVIELEVDEITRSKKTKEIVITYFDINDKNKKTTVRVPEKYSADTPANVEKILIFTKRSTAYRVAKQQNLELAKEYAVEVTIKEEELESLKKSLDVLKEHNVQYEEEIINNGG